MRPLMIKEELKERIKDNSSNRNMNARELADEELDQVSAGFLGFLIPIAKKIVIEVGHLFK